MEDILTKALGEVLTPRYSLELRDTAETGYVPSAEFERRMSVLIRKTDRPRIYRYTKYLAAAAAIVIAVGAAVIVPVIMNGRIAVEPAETSVTTAAPVSETVISAVSPVITDTDEPEISTDPGSDVLSDTSGDPERSDTSDTTETAGIPQSEIGTSGTTSVTAEETTASTAAEEASAGITDNTDNTGEHVTVTVNNDTTSEAESEESAGNTEQETTEDEYEESGDVTAVLIDDDEESSGNETDAGSGIAVVVPVTEKTTDDENDIDIDIPADEGDDAYIISDDEEVESVDDTDGDSDGDVVVDSEESDNDDITIIVADDSDDDAAVETNTAITVNEGDTLDKVFAENFGLTFDKLYAWNGSYYYSGDNYNAAALSMNLTDYEFIQDFIHSLGSAKASANAAIGQGKQTLELQIMDVKQPVHIMTDRYNNYSAWRNYSSYFNIGEEDEDIIEEPDDEDDIANTISFFIRVSEDGVVEITNNVFYNNKMYVLGIIRFTVSKADTASLFNKLKKLLIPETVSTVGDIASALEVTADSISQSWCDVRDVYDTAINGGRIGTDYIIGLLTKYRNRTVKKCSPNEVINYEVMISVILKNHARLTFILRADGNMYIRDGANVFRTAYAEGELENSLKAISAANNITIPIYGTLGEYLADKGFSGIVRIQYHTSINGKDVFVSLTDEAELKKLTEMLKAEFASAQYLTDEPQGSSGGRIYLYVNGYHSGNVVLRVGSNTLLVRTSMNNVFALSEGFAEKFRKALLESPKLVIEEIGLSDIDDQDTTEEIDIDDTNPVT